MSHNHFFLFTLDVACTFAVFCRKSFLMLIMRRMTSFEGKDVIISSICHSSNYHNHNVVRAVIHGVVKSIEEEQVYDTTRKKYEKEKYD